MASRVMLKMFRLPKFAQNSYFIRKGVKIKTPRRFFHRSLEMLGVTPIKINMPALSPTMTEGTIIKWIKQEGDNISPGDVLCEVQTDKAIVAFEIDEEGTLAKIMVSENTPNVPLGTLIALMVEEGEDWKDVEIPEPEVVPAQVVPDVGPPSAQPPQPAPAAVPSEPTPLVHEEHPARMGPSVVRLLEQYAIRSEEIAATGPHGNLTKGDVLKHISSKDLKPVEMKVVPDAVQPIEISVTEGPEFVDIELSNMRKTIAKRLTESKQTIPHSYTTGVCDLTEIQRLRKQFAEEGVKLSVNDFIIKSAAIALQQVPEVNSTWNEQSQSAQLWNRVDISVAVATDAGLITPILTNVGALGLQDISAQVKELATKAREGKLQPHEFQGGTFTISNLGMFGILEFTAVINPPQCCIMAVGTTQDVLDEHVGHRTLLNVTLSSDVRAVDDAKASKFLEVFTSLMSNPMYMVAGAPVKTKSVEI